MNDLVVKVKKTINAPIEQVFDAWLDADTLSKFMMPMDGMPEPRVEAEGREGGRFTVYMMVGDKELPHSGQYLEVDKPHKLVFTWESHCSSDDSTVTILFSALNETQTEVDFTHIKFIDDETRSNHENGWTTILNKLNQLCSPSTQSAPNKQQATA